MADSTPTPDEQPKQAIAKKVITPKRKYFLPDYSHLGEIEADSAEEAEAIAKKQVNSKEVAE